MKPSTKKTIHITINKYLILLFIIILTPTQLCFSAGTPSFSPYIEKFQNGWIDWENGFIYGIGKGYLHKNNNIRSRAKGAANLIAYSNILKLAAGINLDDKNVLNSLGPKSTTIHLKAFVKAREYSSRYISSTSTPHFEVIKVASMKGINGLSAKLVRHLKSTQWRKLPQRTRNNDLDDENKPWLILDARELGFFNKLEPALFPEIATTSGETIYSLNKVDENALIHRGMAQYVVSSTPFNKLQSNASKLQSLLSEIDNFFSVREAEARDTKRRKRRGRYIVKKVKRVQGLAKTNLVISENDAGNLKNEDASSQILKQCRVIVVVSSPIGGIEGKNRQLPVFPISKITGT